MNIFQKIMPAILAALVFGLPFLIHYGLAFFEPKVFAGLLFAIFVSRILSIPTNNKLFKALMLGLVCLYCGFIAVYESAELLLFYPVLMSTFVALLFFISLFSEKTLVEEFAQLSGKDYPAEAIRYMRGLTKAWVVLLCFNALAASYSACCQSAEYWLLYNGVIAYMIIIAFVVLELLYRGIYRRKFFNS